MSFDSTSEKSRQNTTTQPMAPLMVDMGPVTRSIGRKAITVVSTPKVAGTATRRAPATTLAGV